MKLVKGPIVITKYSCEECEKCYSVTGNMAYCGFSDPPWAIKVKGKDRVDTIWNYRTPNNCPFLIKIIRKEKLKNLEK